MAQFENIYNSDESKKYLQTHLEELKFVDHNVKLKDYCCCACRDLAIRHYNANCGDVFCHECYFKHYSQPCPRCNYTVNTHSRLPSFERNVFSFRVECKFKKNGCVEIVQLKDFLNHICYCRFATKKLLPKLYKENPNAQLLNQVDGFDDRINRAVKSLQDENKQIRNEFQVQLNSYRNDMNLQAAFLKRLTGTFYDKDRAELMQVEIAHLKVALQKTEENAKVLQEQNISQIKKLDEKYNVLIHNDHESKNATKEMQKEIMLLKGALKKIESQQRLRLDDLEIRLSTQFRNELTECQYRQEGDFIGVPPVVILWKVSRIQEKLRNLMSDGCININSEEFFTVSGGLKFQARLRIYSHIKCVLIRLEFTDDLKAISNASLPCSKKFILLDQSNSLDKNNIELLDRPSFGMNSTEEKMLLTFNHKLFFPACLLKGENQYLKNDQILIKIIIKPISFLYKNIASNDGTLHWRIDNYSKKKRDEIDEVQHFLISKPFKTSETGYLLQVELFLNGKESAQGQFLSIFSRVITGENDADLPGSFKYRCSYNLLDQSDSRTKRDITISDRSIVVDRSKSDRGFLEFVHQDQAENPKYLKDDSILIKVVAQVL